MTLWRLEGSAVSDLEISHQATTSGGRHDGNSFIFMSEILSCRKDIVGQFDCSVLIESTVMIKERASETARESGWQ